MFYIVSDSITLNLIVNLSKCLYASKFLLVQCVKLLLNFVNYVNNYWSLGNDWIKEILYSIEEFIFGLGILKETEKDTLFLSDLVFETISTLNLHSPAMRGFMSNYSTKSCIGIFRALRTMLMVSIVTDTKNETKCFENIKLSNALKNYWKFINIYSVAKNEFHQSQFISDFEMRIEQISHNLSFFAHNETKNNLPNSNSLFKTIDVQMDKLLEQHLHVLSMMYDEITQVEIVILLQQVVSNTFNLLFSKYSIKPNSSYSKILLEAFASFCQMNDFVNILTPQFGNKDFQFLMWSTCFSLCESDFYLNYLENGRLGHTQFIKFVYKMIDPSTVHNVLSLILVPIDNADNYTSNSSFLNTIVFEIMFMNQSTSEKLSMKFVENLKITGSNNGNNNNLLDLNYDFILVKIFIARFNLFYIFKPCENYSFLKIMSKLFIKSFAVPFIRTDSPLRSTLLSLATFTCNQDTINISLDLMMSNIGTLMDLPNFESMKLWMRVLRTSNERKMVNEQDFKENFIILRDFVQDLFVLANTNEIKGFYNNLNKKLAS